MYRYRFPFFTPPAFSKMNNPTYSKFNNKYYNNFSNNYSKMDKTVNCCINSNNDINNSEDSKVNDSSFHISSNEVLFEILGIKIYLDDLLIILLLIFLYEEGIQDEYLYIALILLLLN